MKSIMKKKEFRAAVVQTLAVLGDIQANITIVKDHIEEAIRQGAELVVLPECMNSGYLFDSADHCLQIAERLDGTFCKAISALCQKHGIYIATGFTEKGNDGKAYNSALLFDRQGTLICHYQKQFLATHDQNWFEVGVKGNPVVDTDLGRIGLLICFDGRIPEIARSLSTQGAEIILDMANFFAMDQAEMWVPARALENGVWIVAATKSGVERSIYYPGGSMIVSPRGEIHAQVPYDTHGVASTLIDLNDPASSQWPFGGHKMEDRRPETYRLLLQKADTTPLGPLLRHPLIPEDSTVKIAAIQAHVDEAHTIEDALAMVEYAALLGVKILALPLHFSAGHWNPSPEDALHTAKASAEITTRLARLCKQHDALVVFPTIGEEHGRYFAESLLIGPAGILGRQRQVHTAPRTTSWANPTARDNDFHVFDTQHGRIGMLLDYDGMFPESSRVMALKGVEIIIWSSAWEHPAQRQLLAVPKAEDNRVYVACVNRADAPCHGGSLVIGPNGLPSWDVAREAPIIKRWGAVLPAYASLAYTHQKEMIPGVDMLRNRVVTAYGPITKANIPAEPKAVSVP